MHDVDNDNTVIRTKEKSREIHGLSGKLIIEPKQDTPPLPPPK